MPTCHASRSGFLPADSGPNLHRFRHDAAYILECGLGEVDEATWAPYFERGLTASQAIAERHADGMPLPGPNNH